MIMNDLLRLKDALIREYQVAIKCGVHDSLLYSRIMDINRQIRAHNRWSLGNTSVVNAIDLRGYYEGNDNKNGE